MALNYQAPGIYIEEVQTGPRPIGAIGTSTAAFLGVAPAADAHLNEAVSCNSWFQFAKAFITEGSPSTPLAQAVYGFFGNGGSRCYVVNVGRDKNGKEKPITGDARQRKGIQCLEPIDEVAIVSAPGYTDPLSHETLLSHCEKWGCFAIMDASPEGERNIELLKTVVTIGEPDSASEGSKGKIASGLRPRNSPGGYAAFYFPWIIAKSPLDQKPTATPPAGHIAGVFARTDETRGVFKAPANEPITGALGLTYLVTREEQGLSLIHI